jgi:hypothetical protein
MPLSLKVLPQKDHLSLSIEGSYGFPEAMEIINLLFKSLEENPASKVLIDVRGVQGQIPSLERFHLFETFAILYSDFKKMGKFSYARFAILGIYPVIDPEKFDETVAVNRGMALKVTSDLNEALEWLSVGK